MIQRPAIRFVVGRSVHSLDAALRARRMVLITSMAGPVYETPSHPEAPAAGVALIRADRRVPSAFRSSASVAITQANAGDVVRAGASGVAVISAILDPPKGRAAAAELRGALDAAWVAAVAEPVIAVTVNGKPRELEGPLPVTALLQMLDINPKQVAVALNGEVVRRDDWPSTVIGEGDRLEIVRAVGGGAHVTPTKKEPLAMDALLLLLAFAAGAAAATQVLVNGSISGQRGSPEALMVSVTVTYGAVILFMTARYMAGGGLNLRVPTEPLLYLLPLAVVVVLAFFGLMRGFEWYHFLGGLAGALIVWTVAVAGPRIGIAATSAALISGQMTGAIIYDHLGLLEQAKDPIDALKVLGVMLIVGGVLLVRGL